MLKQKNLRRLFSLLLSLVLVFSLTAPFASAREAAPEQDLTRAETVPADLRSVNSRIVIDDNAAGGYEGDYVVIYNPATSASTSYSTGTLTGLIDTSVNQNAVTQPEAERGRPSLIIDVDGAINERNRREDPNYGVIPPATRAPKSYSVGDTKSFTISSYNPGSGTSLSFKVLAVGEHCYIWTPSQNVTNYYTLDSIDASYAQQAADEFDRMIV